MVKLFISEMENAKAHSKVFAEKVLSEYLNVDQDRLAVCRDSFGKPYLKNYPDIHYNISHTKGVIVCAVSNKPVGVDIERIKKVNHGIVKRFFTVDEQNYILNSKGKEDERFIEIWTKKEAYVKWIGKGMEIPFEAFDTFCHLNDMLEVISIKDYVIALCMDKVKLYENTIKDTIKLNDLNLMTGE